MRTFCSRRVSLMRLRAVRGDGDEQWKQRVREREKEKETLPAFSAVRASVKAAPSVSPRSESVNQAGRTEISAHYTSQYFARPRISCGRARTGKIQLVSVYISVGVDHHRDTSGKPAAIIWYAAHILIIMGVLLASQASDINCVRVVGSWALHGSSALHNGCYPLRQALGLCVSPHIWHNPISCSSVEVPKTLCIDSISEPVMRAADVAHRRRHGGTRSHC